MKKLALMPGILIILILSVSLVYSLTNCAEVYRDECCGEKDNFCPWVARADCSYDPDCYINISGYVFYEGFPKSNITVEAIPLIEGINSKSTLTDENGYYFLQIDLQNYTYISDFVFAAHGAGLDSVGARFPYYLMPPSNIEHNFTLYNSTCTPECVDTRNLCNFNCLNYESEYNEVCSPVDPEILQLCNDRPIGDYVYWKTVNNEKWYAKCCEGSEIIKIPISGGGIEQNPTSGINTEALTKQTITAKIGGLPVNIVIVTWE